MFEECPERQSYQREGTVYHEQSLLWDWCNTCSGDGTLWHQAIEYHADWDIRPNHHRLWVFLMLEVCLRNRHAIICSPWSWSWQEWALYKMGQLLESGYLQRRSDLILDGLRAIRIWRLLWQRIPSKGFLLLWSSGNGSCSNPKKLSQPISHVKTNSQKCRLLVEGVGNVERSKEMQGWIHLLFWTSMVLSEFCWKARGFKTKGRIIRHLDSIIQGCNGQEKQEEESHWFSRSDLKERNCRSWCLTIWRWRLYCESLNEKSREANYLWLEAGKERRPKKWSKGIRVV